MRKQLEMAPLVSIAGLSAQNGQEGCIVIDCRFDLSRPEAGEKAYQAGHIPGARYAHLDRDLSSPRRPSTGRHPLPDPARLREVFSRWGIGSDSCVIAYDDCGGAIAARLWWLLRWMGHRAVGLLDGGWNGWTAAGMPVSTDAPRSPGRRFSGSPGQMPVAETSEIENRLDDPRLLIVDARAQPRYLGEIEPIDSVAGHIPGAKNLPFSDSLTAAGTFKDPAELRRNVGPFFHGRQAQDVVVMCGSGVTACHNILAMELTGFSGARLYPGSWSEWITDPRRPVSRTDC